jgi:DNA-binding NtrC family response regulator
MQDAILVTESTLSIAPERRTTTSPVPVLYIALEGARPSAGSVRLSLATIDKVTIGRGAERAASLRVEDGCATLVVTIPDARMSSHHATLERELGRWIVADAGSKNGTVADGVAIERIALQGDALIELGNTVLVFRREVLAAGSADVVDARDLTCEPHGLATIMPGLEADLAKLRTVARSAVPILIGGETGTGKELIARAVHALSQREGELVAVNCGAIPDTLIESELFGVVKGAYSGAVQDRPGLIRRADRGTLFLDEIGDLAPGSQAALLRVLQEREVVPVGGTRAVAVDYRLISATHRDLDEQIEHDQFRRDLYARVAGFRIELPPLRERRGELGLIVGTLLRRLAGDRAGTLRLGLDATRALSRYAWPHNIRELERSLEAAIALAVDGTIELEHLPVAVQAVLRDPASQLSAEELHDRDELLELLRRHGGNISAIARQLGKARMQIQRWLRRYGIDPEPFRTR